MGKGNKKFPKKKSSKFVLFPKANKQENENNLFLPVRKKDENKYKEIFGKNREEEEEDLGEKGDREFSKQDLEFGEYGFPDDGYDYSQHFIQPNGGIFIPASAEGKPAKDLVLKNLGLKDAEEVVKVDFMDGTFDDEEYIDKQELNEIDRFFDNEDEIEDDLQDDFVMQAMGGEMGFFGGEGYGEGDEEYEDMEFDDKDLPPMLRNLFLGNGGGSYEYGDDDGEDYDGEDGEDEDMSDEYDDDRRTKASNLDEDFDNFLENYDDDQIGELDQDDPNVKGDMEISDRKLESYMDEFLHKNNIKFADKITEKSTPEQILSEKEKQEAATLILNQLESGLIEEDESYEYIEEEDKKEKWDCESILSTYTNTENHPRLIKLPKKLDKGSNATSNSSSVKTKIELSKKTGIPLNVLSNTKPSKKDISDVNETKKANVVSRSKQETPEEKKLRKKMVKEDKKKTREQKKELKLAYKSERIKQIQHNNQNPFNNKSIIHL